MIPFSTKVIEEKFFTLTHPCPRDVHGGAAAAEFFKKSSRSGRDFYNTVAAAARRRQVFYEEISKIHEITLNFGLSIRYTVRLKKFDRLAAVILVQTSHRLENQNIFLNTIAAAVAFF